MKQHFALCFGLSVLGCASEAVAPDAGAVVDSGAVVSVDSGTPDVGPRACERWLIEYDLAGSEFEIRNTPFGAGDANNAVGPGRLQLLFLGAEDGPRQGPVALTSYELSMEFTVAMVETDVDIAAGPDDCGVAMGTRTSSAVTWATPISGYRSSGTVTCNASELLCAAAGLPVGEAVPEESSHAQTLTEFRFPGEGDFSSFTMAEVEVPNDDAGDTFLRLRGVQVSRSCVPAPSDCD